MNNNTTITQTNANNPLYASFTRISYQMNLFHFKSLPRLRCLQGMFSEDHTFMANLTSNFTSVLGNVPLEDTGKPIDKPLALDFVLSVFVCYSSLTDHLVTFFLLSPPMASVMRCLLSINRPCNTWGTLKSGFQIL